MLDNFPFTIRGFHADNGSEYINHRVARLLEKLHIELTKSRPRHSNDNGPGGDRLVMTPLEKLASLPDANTFLKPGTTLAQLQAEATRLTDNDAAQQLNEARRSPPGAWTRNTFIPRIGANSEHRAGNRSYSRVGARRPSTTHEIDGVHPVA